MHNDCKPGSTQCIWHQWEGVAERKHSSIYKYKDSILRSHQSWPQNTYSICKLWSAIILESRTHPNSAQWPQHDVWEGKMVRHSTSRSFVLLWYDSGKHVLLECTRSDQVRQEHPVQQTITSLSELFKTESFFWAIGYQWKCCFTKTDWTILAGVGFQDVRILIIQEPWSGTISWRSGPALMHKKEKQLCWENKMNCIRSTYTNIKSAYFKKYFMKMGYCHG